MFFVKNDNQPVNKAIPFISRTNKHIGVGVKMPNLGFPRIGAKHELKFSLEKYWRGDLSQTDFLTECQNRCQQNGQSTKSFSDRAFMAES